MNLEIPTDVINFIMGGAVFSIMMLFMQLQMRYSENQAIKRKRKMNELTESQIKRINTILNEASTPKPKKKIIALSKMVGSDFDMSFGSDFIVPGESHTSKLKEIRRNGYICNEDVKYKCCRIRQNHIHYYDGRENPLPDGLLVKLYFSNYTPTTYKSQNIDWVNMFFCLHDIKGFEVLEVLPEYKYGWEK